MSRQTRSRVFSIIAVCAWVVVLAVLATGATRHDGPMYTMGDTLTHGDGQSYTIVGVTHYSCTRIDGTHEKGIEYQCMPSTHGKGTDMIVVDESDIVGEEGR